MSLYMCPHCGQLFTEHCEQIPTHDYPPLCRSVCPGSGQHPRNPSSDRRPLWNGLPNPHLDDGPGARSGAKFVVGTAEQRAAHLEQLAHDLEPVGIDFDGTVKPAAELSYSAADVVQVDAHGTPVALSLVIDVPTCPPVTPAPMAVSPRWCQCKQCVAARGGLDEPTPFVRGPE